jgi:hypothetical protein
MLSIEEGLLYDSQRHLLGSDRTSKDESPDP